METQTCREPTPFVEGLGGIHAQTLFSHSYCPGSDTTLLVVSIFKFFHVAKLRVAVKEDEDQFAQTASQRLGLSCPFWQTVIPTTSATGFTTGVFNTQIGRGASPVIKAQMKDTQMLIHVYMSSFLVFYFHFVPSL